MKMFLLNKIEKSLKQTLAFFNWSSIPFELWISKDAQRAHLITNLIPLIVKKYHLSPDEVAKSIIDNLQKTEKIITKINCNNNFLYIFVQIDYLFKIIPHILEKKMEFGKLNLGNNKTVNYEWVSANPTGYLHIGHARNVFLGQAITNILSFVGYSVVREFYINDHGNQIFQLGRSVFFHYQKLCGLNPSSFAELYLNNEVETSAKEAFLQFGKNDQNACFQKDNIIQKKFISFAKNFFLNKMKADLLSFGIKFDIWFSESTFYEKNQLKNLITRLKEKNAVYQKDGALWFEASKYSDQPDFVLIKSDKLSTYFAGDIMYHDDKFKRNYDLCIDLFGADHHSHYLKIKTGLKVLGWDVNKFYVDLLQMVTIMKEGEVLKISKRKGTSIPLIDLIKLTEIDFVRFMLLSRQKESKFLFDLNLINVKKNQNPFFYAQYAYARSFQLLKKINLLTTQEIIDYSLLNSIYEQDLVLALHQFEIFLKKAALKREPQVIINYVLYLSKCFHIFYEKVPLLNISSSLQTPRVQLVKVFQQVFFNALSLLGIKVKKKI